MYNKSLLKSIVQVLITGGILTVTASYVPAIQPSAAMRSYNALAKDTTISLADTSKLALNDSTSTSKKKKKQAIESPIVYSAKDTMEFDMLTKTVYLQNEGKVNYQKIELKASHIEMDMGKEKVYAVGVADTTGKIVGKPEFKEGSETFIAEDLTYNFKSKKGFIHAVKTKQGEGNLHSEYTKRMPNGHIHMKNGKYTTCDADHPHFYLALTKATSIPDDKIVSGPAYLVMADIPLPIGLPFGFFPNTKKAQSGIIIPSYGEESTRGFFLRNGGFYWYINDYIDAKLLADIYTLGSWGFSVETGYRQRYRYNGNFLFRYNNNKLEDNLGAPYHQIDYAINWTHSQDAKANPYRNLSANVNYSTSQFDRRNSYSLSNALRSQKMSSISYSQRWPTNPFNLTASMNATQNSQTRKVNLNFPNASFNMGTLYPLRNEEQTGQPKWYENLQVSYTSSLQNEVETTDSMLLKKETWKHTKAGFKHEIPISISFKLFKDFSISPILTYSGILNNQTGSLSWDPNHVNANGSHGKIDTVMHTELAYAHAYYPSINASWTPKLYGTYQFKKSRIEAMRHVLSPSIGFSLIPDVRSINSNYSQSVQIDSTGKRMNYTKYDLGRFQAPSALNGKSASFSLALRNTLEMKKYASDTATKADKVRILDNFDFTTNYNVYTPGDTMHWSPVNFNTGTKLFKGKLDIRFNATLDPYAIDKKGTKYNTFQWDINQQLFRLTTASISASTSFTSEQGKKKETTNTPTAVPIKAPDGTILNPTEMIDRPSDFDIPWSINISYSWSYTKVLKATRLNTINFSGDLSLTKKTKIGFSSGYDLEAQKVTLANFNISRDLHCWEARFSWVPFGYMQSYFFTINVKSSMLRDLKYEQRSSPYDNYIYK